MSNTAKPVDTRTLDGEEVRSYDLPQGGETVFNLDTSETGYTVEWRVSDRYQASSQEDFLRSLIGQPSVEASYEDVFYMPEMRLESGLSKVGDRPAEVTIGNESTRGAFDEVTSVIGYPEECTYLRVEAETFDIEWEDWEDYNRVMLSGPGEDPNIVREVFARFFDDHQDLVFGKLHRIGLKEVIDTIESDCERRTLDKF